MRILTLAAVSSVLVLTSSCAGPAPQYRTTATVKDIMDSVVDPNADYIWKSVESRVTAKGVIDKAPTTDDDWTELRRHGIALQEATDLLQIPGRQVARPGEKAQNPKIEEPPEVIKTLIDSDRAKWIQFNHGLHDSVAILMKAIDAKNVTGVEDAGGAIDAACEACHKQYWYPEKNKP